MSYNYHDLSKMIDHSLLSPALDSEALERGCRLARAYDVASVCIMPYYVTRCFEILAGTTVAASTVIGFPHGGQATSIKIAEAHRAVTDGAIELDMVVNISAVLSNRWDYVREEIAGVIEVAHAGERKVKVIFENCYLQDDHKKLLCEICCDLNADWVKTSTGYGSGGATIEDVQLMLQHTEPPTKVKAAGGIRDLPKLLQYRQLGVSRIGASATATILDAARQELGLPPIEHDDRDSTVSGY